MINDENSKSSVTEDDSGIQIKTPGSLSQESTASITVPNRKRSPVLETDEDDTDLDVSGSSEPVSRKEKSLGKLCKRFLLTMDEESSTGQDVHLETVARNMSVEKRRIYDIVNVMEALEAMRKTNKSYYKWNGLEKLPILMHQLIQEALAENLPAKITQVEQAMCSFTEISGVSAPTSNEPVSSIVSDSPGTATTPLTQNDSFKSSNGRDRNGKNSLAQLCRRFLMVLLCNTKDKRRVSLDVASTVLIKDPDSEGLDPPSRSRCRRLYDIANVLVAMNLIKKVHYLFGTKKIPLFVYCGPEPEEDAVAAAFSMKTFLAANGMTEAEVAALRPPAAKLRRVSSEVVSKTESAVPGPSSSFPLQRSVTLCELNSSNSLCNETSLKLLNMAMKANQPPAPPTTDDNDKENTAPTSFVAKLESAEVNPTENSFNPISRPVQRQPLGPLNPSYLSGLPWPSFNNTLFAQSPYLHSMSTILNAAQQQQQQQQQQQAAFVKQEPNLYQSLSSLPPMSLPSLVPSTSTPTTSLSDLAKAAYYLQNLCNSQPKY